MRRFAFLLVLLVLPSCIFSSQAPLHFRRHDEAEARWRACAFARRQMGTFRCARCRSGGEQEDLPHLDRPAEWCSEECGDGDSPAQSERILIADQDGDRPRWAPNGKRFAFLSNKEGGSQVWIADFDGGAGTVTSVHKHTAIATEAGGELWSPDGKNILFTSDVYPECDGAPAAEADCNARRLKESEDSKVKALIFDRLLYRHWNAYKEECARTSSWFPMCSLPRDLCLGQLPRALGSLHLLPATSRPATTTRPCSRSADRTTTPSRPTGRRFATPRTTTRSKPRPPTTISGSSR